MKPNRAHSQPAAVFGGLLALLLGGCEDGALPNDVLLIPHPSVDSTPPEASFAPGQRRDVGDADVILTLPQPTGAEIGAEIAGVEMPGDLDGDGVDDLVVWSVVHGDADLVDCQDGCPAFQRLSVRALYGGSGWDLEAAPSLVGPWINDVRGWVAPAGDLDGDGADELLISVGGACQQGSVYTIRGGARWSGTADLREVGELVRETGACTGFGHARGIGDLDGDGSSDFGVASLANGRAFVFRGTGPVAARRTEGDADLVLDDRAGLIQPAGDVNGDGVPDLLLAPEIDGERVHGAEPSTWRLLFGERDDGGLSLTGDEVRILSATLVVPLGDLDGDGRDELGVSHEGGAGVLPGRMSWPVTLDREALVLRLPRAPTRGTVAFRRIGDVDGDGVPDLAHTDSGEAPDGVARGALRLFLGPLDLTRTDLAPDEALSLLGRAWRDDEGRPRGHDALGAWGFRLGMGFAGGADLDGDGYDDLAVIGRYGDTLAGHLYVWRGRP